MSFRLPVVSRFFSTFKPAKSAPRRRARHSISLGEHAHLLEARRMMSGNQPPAAVALDDVVFDEDSQTDPIDVARAFSDPDNWGDELTFSITNHDPDLVTFSHDGTGQVMLYGVKDAFGVGSLTIRATDPSGAWAETVLTFEILPVNDPPMIVGFAASLTAGVWALYGTVVDVDDDVEGFVVEFGGQLGQYFTSVTVDADGSFRTATAVVGTSEGTVTAITEDPLGLESNLAMALVPV